MGHRKFVEASSGRIAPSLDSAAVANHTAEVVITLAADGYGTWVSPSVHNLLGYTPAQMLAAPLAVVHDDDRPALESAITQTAASNQAAVELRVRMQCSDGTVKWMEACVSRNSGTGGSESEVVLLLRDITTLVAAEKRVHELEQRNRSLTQLSPGELFSFNREGTVQWLSDSAADMIGWSADAIIGRHIDDLVHPDEREQLRTCVIAADTPAACECKARWRSANGEYRWLGLSLRPVQDDAGNVASWLGILRDIATEIAARESLAREHERLTALLKSTLEPHAQLQAVRDDNGTIVDFLVEDVNDAACEFLDIPREQLLGARMAEFVSEETQRSVLARYARVVETGESLDSQAFPSSFLGAESDGEAQRRFDVKAVKYADGVSLTWRDVTQTYEMAQALAASEQDFKLLAESIGDVVRVIDTNGLHTWVSPSVTKLLGYTPEELIGTFAQAIIHPDDLAPALAMGISTGMSRGVVTPPRRTRVRHADGHWVWTETTNSFAYDDDGNVTELYAVTRDAQAAVAAELELQRLATTDPLTGLLNRASIIDQLNDLAKLPQSDTDTTAVLFCDLDNLKDVNDTHGHAVGDAVITAAADRAREYLDDDALVARFGGDEVLVVLPHVPGLAAALGIAEGVRQAIATTVTIPETGVEIQTGVSVGIALLHPGEPVDEVISRADTAMYQAKADGRNAVAISM